MENGKLILAIRTDKPEAELGLYEDGEQLAYEIWHAHRELAETIHLKIHQLLSDNHKTIEDLGGIVVYKGPGSFTGLRIGLSVANALAYGLNIPIIGETDEDWAKKGCERITAGATTSESVLPEYGAPVHLTAPKGSKQLTVYG